MTDTGRRLTAKGAATRDRIIEAAAQQVLARGVGKTSLDEIGSATGTSRSQLFHYFPSGKHELVRAIVAHQGNRVLDAQRPALDELDTWESWEAWRDQVIAYYSSEGGVRGCPIGSLAAEVATTDEVLRNDLVTYTGRWREMLSEGVARLREAGLVDADVDPEAFGFELLAAIQGGLLLSQTEGSLRPLELALDGAVAHLRSHAL